MWFENAAEAGAALIPRGGRGKGDKGFCLQLALIPRDSGIKVQEGLLLTLIPRG